MFPQTITTDKYYEVRCNLFVTDVQTDYNKDMYESSLYIHIINVTMEPILFNWIQDTD